MPIAINAAFITIFKDWSNAVHMNYYSESKAKLRRVQYNK